MILSWIVIIDVVVNDGSHRFGIIIIIIMVVAVVVLIRWSTDQLLLVPTSTSSLGRSGSSVVMVEFQLQWAFERTTADRSRGSLEGKMCEIHNG